MNKEKIKLLLIGDLSGKSVMKELEILLKTFMII